MVLKLFLTFLLFFYPLLEINAQWIELTPIKSKDNITCFASRGDSLFAGTYESGLWLSTNEGKSWSKIEFSEMEYETITELVFYNEILLAASSTLYTGIVGKVWIIQEEIKNKVTTLCFHNRCEYVGTNKGIYTKLIFSRGQNCWVSFDNDWEPRLPDLSITSMATMEDKYLFSGTENSGVYRSMDDGKNFIEINNGLTNKKITALAVIDKNLFAATGDGIFLSTDQGTSWIKSNTGLTSNIRRFAVFGKNLFGSAGIRGVLFFNDGTQSWIDCGLPKMYVGALAVCGTNLLVGSSDGKIWKRPISEIIK